MNFAVLGANSLSRTKSLANSYGTPGCGLETVSTGGRLVWRLFVGEPPNSNQQAPTKIIKKKTTAARYIVFPAVSSLSASAFIGVCLNK